SAPSGTRVKISEPRPGRRGRRTGSPLASLTIDVPPTMRLVAARAVGNRWTARAGASSAISPSSETTTVVRATRWVVVEAIPFPPLGILVLHRAGSHPAGHDSRDAGFLNHLLAVRALPRWHE